MKKLRLVGTVLPPWLNDCFAEENCKSPGIEARFIIRALGVLGFEPDFIKVESEQEIREMLQNDSADVKVIATYLYNLDNIDSIGYTTRMGEDRPNYWVKDTGVSKGTHDVILSIFQLPVWSLVIALLLSVLFIRSSFKRRQKRAQGSMQFSSITTKMTSKIWWFIFGIFLATYANILAIELSFSKPSETPFRDLEDLSWKLYNRECRLTMSNIEFSFTQPGENLLMTVAPNLEKSSSVPLEIRKRLIKAFEMNPPIYHKTSRQMYNAVATEKCTIALDWEYARSFVEAQYCGIKYVEDIHAKLIPFGYLYNKKLTAFGEAFNYILTLTSPNDVYFETMKRESARNAKTCILADNKPKKLKLNQLVEVFYVLCTGIIIAAGACLWEWLSNKKKPDYGGSSKRNITQMTSD